MAKKHVPVHIPAQLGFGFEVLDAQGKAPNFLYLEADVLGALDLIEQSQWVSVDVETTGLTEASNPVPLATIEIKQGASNSVRMRTIQARVPTVNGRRGPRIDFAFDVDRMGPALSQRVARAILTRRMFIAHNAGFDLYWLRRAEGRSVMPAMVVDSMLLTRLLDPKLVLKRAELIEGIKHVSEVATKNDVTQAAWKSLITGASGGSLADVVLAMFGVVVDKKYQKPNNWTGLLGFAHYDYAIDDVVWADRILCYLLGVEQDAGDLLTAYLSHRARRATVRLIEPQVPDLVRLRETGMPMNVHVGRMYVARKREELAKKVDELIEIEPALEIHRRLLADPDAGLDDALKKALATAFESRGVILRRTAATGTPQVGEKDLRACRAVQIADSRPLFNAWVAVCKSKKTSAMALDVVGFSLRSDDGKLHSLMSHGPVTGRLSAAEPNCFTGDTEILTAEGWVRFDALTDAQSVMQYDHGQLSLVVPKAHIREPWAGELYHNRTRNLDLLTTPKHRCLLIDSSSGEEIVKSAHDFKEGYRQLHGAAYMGGSGLPLTDRDIRFLVMMQAAGTVRSKGVSITLSSPRKIARLKELFGTDILAGFDNPERNIAGFQFATESPLVTLGLRYLGWEKRFGPWLLDLTRDQLDVFVDELSHWDGLYNDNQKKSICYTAALEENASWVQIAYTLTGSSVRVEHQANRGGSYKSWRVVGLHKPYTLTTGLTQEKVPFSGKVYCVSVDSGFIVVRRNGCVMVTGQCQQFPRDQLFRAMCMSPTRPGCESMMILVTETNKALISEVSGVSVCVGESVEVDTAWMAAMFYNDRHVPSWPAADYDAFSEHLNAQFTHMIIASDFGALDVRVGAALCIRAQREMLALADGTAVPGQVQPPDSVVTVIKLIAACLGLPDPVTALADAEAQHNKQVLRLDKRLDRLREDLDADRIRRSKYFKLRAELKDELLAEKLGWRLAQCLKYAAQRGESDYSGLRDAFVADIDIHTFTGMKLIGRDPMKEFEGLTRADRKNLERTLKAEIGPRRQQGKIANLSLLYGMADAGFQEAAARGYDEHWTLEETHEIRMLWLNGYPEVELWHLWTECLRSGYVYIPEKGKEKVSRVGWWISRTLAGREIVAFGLNAALSYQDQSSGADILGMIMHRLESEYRPIFDASINQVHDEQVLAVPMEKFKEYLPLIETVMVEEADSQTMPYGVPTAVSPACGPLWVKD